MYLLFDRYITWTGENGLKINTLKTKHVLLCPKSKKVELDMSICIHDVNIKNTYLYTYLGCNLDQHLNWESFLGCHPTC